MSALRRLAQPFDQFITVVRSLFLQLNKRFVIVYVAGGHYIDFIVGN